MQELLKDSVPVMLTYIMGTTDTALHNHSYARTGKKQAYLENFRDWIVWYTMALDRIQVGIWRLGVSQEHALQKAFSRGCRWKQVWYANGHHPHMAKVCVDAEGCLQQWTCNNLIVYLIGEFHNFSVCIVGLYNVRLYNLKMSKIGKWLAILLDKTDVC